MLEASETGRTRHLPIRDGDLVCLESDAHELFSVILVREGRCWLRNLQNELDTVSSIHRCRRIGRESTELAGPPA